MSLLKTCDNNENGLHLVIINRISGKVEIAKVFNTVKESHLIDIFITKYTNKSMIIITASQTINTNTFGPNLKSWLISMGMKELN